MKLFLNLIFLNYPLRFQLSLSQPVQATCYPEEIMTDMPYPIYPQGLYNAIRDISILDVPIYITENGIADNKDDRRDIFLRSYIQAMFKAIEEGYDVRGYYYWTFSDNFEWDEGFSMKFGLYSVNFDNQEKTLKKGAEFFKQVIQNSKKSTIT